MSINRFYIQKYFSTDWLCRWKKSIESWMAAFSFAYFEIFGEKFRFRFQIRIIESGYRIAVQNICNNKNIYMRRSFLVHDKKMHLYLHISMLFYLICLHCTAFFWILSISFFLFCLPNRIFLHSTMEFMFVPTGLPLSLFIYISCVENSEIWFLFTCFMIIGHTIFPLSKCLFFKSLLITFMMMIDPVPMRLMLSFVFFSLIHPILVLGSLRLHLYFSSISESLASNTLSLTFNIP